MAAARRRRTLRSAAAVAFDSAHVPVTRDARARCLSGFGAPGRFGRHPGVQSMALHERVPEGAGCGRRPVDCDRDRRRRRRVDRSHRRACWPRAAACVPCAWNATAASDRRAMPALHRRAARTCIFSTTMRSSPMAGKRPLVERFAHDERVAAAVSQLRDPAGRISEAGGIMWSDGQGWNYGRGGSPRDWRYRSPRDVDYGSAASLMVEADVFRRAGGFDPAFQPAYYEDVDLCFRLRAAGGRIVYEPRSIVAHAEGASYGSNVRAPRSRGAGAQPRDLRAALGATCCASIAHPDARNVEAASRRLTKATMLDRRRTRAVQRSRRGFASDRVSRRIAARTRLARRIFGALDARRIRAVRDHAAFGRRRRRHGVRRADRDGDEARRTSGSMLRGCRVREPAARVMACAEERVSGCRSSSTPSICTIAGSSAKQPCAAATRSGKRCDVREMALAREADATVTGGGSECALLRAKESRARTNCP